MKRFTIPWLMKQRADTTAIPAPFPGKIPTRVAIVLIPDNGEQWKYIGRPGSTVGRMLARQREGRYWVCEFDRRNIISCISNMKAGHTRDNPVLKYYYRPWHDKYGHAGRWMTEQPWSSRRITKHSVWVPWAKGVRIPPEKIRTYKEWLVTKGLWKDDERIHRDKAAL